MSVKKIKIIDILNSMSDEGYEFIKRCFSTNRSVLINYELNSDAEKLLRVLGHGTVLRGMPRWTFAWLIDLIMEEYPLHTGNLLFYCGILEKFTKTLHREDIENKRYLEYYDNVINNRIPQLIKSIKSTEDQVDWFEQLTTIYKICTCLIRYSVYKHKNFSLYIRRIDIHLISEYMRDNQKGGILSFNEYARLSLITWIIKALLWDQEGLEEKKVI